MSDYKTCGGCGADNPSKRCIGCFHDFGGDSVSQAVTDAPTPETDNFEKHFPDAPVSGWKRLTKRFERERDELRARLKEAEADYKELARHHNMECTCLEIY
jgi:hypothetical protein